QDEVDHLPGDGHRDRGQPAPDQRVQDQPARLGHDLRQGQGERRGGPEGEREREEVTMTIPAPPTAEVVERLYQFALPAAGGAALVVCVFALLGRWAGALGSAAAVVVAFAWANFAPP